MCFSPAGQRTDRPGDGLERTDGPAHHEQRRGKPDQHAGDPQNDALPLVVGERSGEIIGEHAAPAGADVPQQFGDPADLLAFGAQHFLVERRDLAFRPRDRNDRVGIGVDRGAQLRRIVIASVPHAPGRLLGGRRIVRQQRFGDLVLRPEQVPRGVAVRHFGDRGFEPLAHRRQCRDQLGAARDQSGDALDSLAVIRQPLRDAVDHVLLLGRQFQPRPLQERAQRRRRRSDPVGRRARIGDEIAGRQPQFVHAPVDLLGDVAEAIEPLQLGKGRVDVADRDHAGDAGHHDHGQQQHEAGKGQLTDRKRK